MELSERMVQEFSTSFTLFFLSFQISEDNSSFLFTPVATFMLD